MYAERQTLSSLGCSTCSRCRDNISRDGSSRSQARVHGVFEHELAPSKLSGSANLLLQIQRREHGLLAGHQKHLLHRRLDRQRAAPDAGWVRRQLAPAQDEVSQLRRGGGNDLLSPALRLRLLGEENLKQWITDEVWVRNSTNVRKG